MVPNFLFFGSAILTPQNFWLNIFVIAYCNCLKQPLRFLCEKNEISRTVFSLISIYQHFGGTKKFDLPLKSPPSKIINTLFQQLYSKPPNLSQTSLVNSSGKCLFLFYFFFQSNFSHVTFLRSENSFFGRHSETVLFCFVFGFFCCNLVVIIVCLYGVKAIIKFRRKVSFLTGSPWYTTPPPMH